MSVGKKQNTNICENENKKTDIDTSEHIQLDGNNRDNVKCDNNANDNNSENSKITKTNKENNVKNEINTDKLTKTNKYNNKNYIDQNNNQTMEIDNICQNQKTCEDINTTIEIANDNSLNISMKNSVCAKKKIVLLKRNEIKYNKYYQGGTLNNNNEYENTNNFNRRNNNKNNSNKYNLNGKNTKGEKTLEQREQEYNKIRARIFSNFNKNTKNNSTYSTIPNIIPRTLKNDNVYIIPPCNIPLNNSLTNSHIDPYFYMNNYYNTYNNMINPQYVNNNMPIFDINPIVNLPPSQFYCNTDTTINMFNHSENKINPDIINCNLIPNANSIYPNYPCNIQGYPPFLKFNNSQIIHKKIPNGNKYNPNYNPPNHITNFNNQNNMNSQKNNKKKIVTSKVKNDNNMTPLTENATNKEKIMDVNNIRDVTKNICRNMNGNTNNQSSPNIITYNNQSIKEKNINYEQDHAPINVGFSKSIMNIHNKNPNKVKLSNSKKFYTSQNNNLDKKGKGPQKKTISNINITGKTLQNNTISYDKLEIFKNSPNEYCTPPTIPSNISKPSHGIEPTNNNTEYLDIKNEINIYNEEGQTQLISTSSQKKLKKKSKKKSEKKNTNNTNINFDPELINFNDTKIKNSEIDEQNINTNNEKSNTTPKKKKKKKKKKINKNTINDNNSTLNPQPSIIIPNKMQTNFNSPNKFSPLIVNNAHINSHSNYNFINNIPTFQQYYPNDMLNNLEYCRDISLYEKRYDRNDDLMLNPKRYDIDFPSLH
ncbi:SUZ domain-containing protein, putative [Plasmodium berghei ANKA]|uniref:SUZ domain-containing protein, putative n=1 Tax=Plasmodium berghei (strain Anka) TaxID=5823 RepID=A0A509AF41_PLABA|nr:SUZ domain-containing protein, putative [Plasmodium berghei ANKA]VUC54187.1 SUZ domain-containing protein, putative [Plasmodium berghei ANKA]|eukprot:XP_034420032.1 SUZ domain-containing protein, putative [Plasmodium berghei ANKA]